MDKIGLEFFFEIEQPAPALFHVLPGLLHPFKFQVAVVKLQSGNSRRFGSLCRRSSSAERRETNLSAVRSQLIGQLDGEIPDASNGIACHQNTAGLTLLHDECPHSS
jgi:hypothetical protein